MQVVFYISGAIAILATVLMLTRLNAVHALLYLVVSLLAIAVVFYDLGAALAAALEVIIYDGAIMVLFIFVVMLLNLGERAANEEKRLLNASMGLGPALLAAVLIAELVSIWSAEPHGNVPAPVGPEQVATALY